MFISKEHENRYKELLKRAGEKCNNERKPLFYICAAYEDLYVQVDLFYDFAESKITPEKLLNVDFAYNSYKVLIELAYNLYNYYTYPCDVCEMMSVCDKVAKNVAIEAMRIRFDI